MLPSHLYCCLPFARLLSILPSSIVFIIVFFIIMWPEYLTCLFRKKIVISSLFITSFSKTSAFDYFWSLEKKVLLFVKSTFSQSNYKRGFSLIDLSQWQIPLGCGKQDLSHDPSTTDNVFGMENYIAIWIVNDWFLYTISVFRKQFQRLISLKSLLQSAEHNMHSSLSILQSFHWSRRGWQPHFGRSLTGYY